MRKRTLAYFIGYAIAIALIILTWEENLLLSAVLLALTLLAFKFLYGKGDLLLFVIAAVMGPLGEAIISGAGAFSYAKPFVAGIPLWLPLVWGNGILVLKGIAESL